MKLNRWMRALRGEDIVMTSRMHDLALSAEEERRYMYTVGE